MRLSCTYLTINDDWKNILRSCDIEKCNFFSAKNVHVLFSKIIRIFFIHFFLSSLNIDSQFHSNNIYLSRHFNFAYGFQFRVTGCQCIDTRDRRFLETRREWEPIPCSALPNIPIVSLLKVQRKAGTGTYFRRFFFSFLEIRFGKAIIVSERNNNSLARWRRK